MKYLVLGSAGQVGVPLCDHLRQNGHTVFEFDVEDNPIEDLRINSNELLEQKIVNCDFVIFLAFDVGGSKYLEKYEHTFDFIHNNVRLMANTFELISKYQKPFIFSSSQMSNMSHSPYGIAKTVGETYTSILGGLTVKFWNVYGPEHNDEKSHVITDFILKARDTGVIDMRTDGTEVRQFLYAKDCSKALEALSHSYDEIPKDKELHITNFKWNSILEVAEIVASHYKNVIIQPSTKRDMVQRDKRNEADPYILNFWKPEIELSEGISKMIEYYNERAS